jgi:hypothetical protein
MLSASAGNSRSTPNTVEFATSSTRTEPRNILLLELRSVRCVWIRFDSYFCALNLKKMSNFFKYSNNVLQVSNIFETRYAKNLLLQYLADLSPAFCYQTIQKMRLEDIFASSFRFGPIWLFSM